MDGCNVTLKERLNRPFIFGGHACEMVHTSATVQLALAYLQLCGLFFGVFLLSLNNTFYCQSESEASFPIPVQFRIALSIIRMM